MKVSGLVTVLLLLAAGVVGVVCLVKTSGQDSLAFQTVEADLGKAGDALEKVSNDLSATAVRSYHELQAEYEKAEAALADASKDLSKTAVRDYHTLEVDFEKAEKAVVAMGNEIADVFRKLHITDGCECVADTCGCCSHIEEEQIHLNATACVNVTYLSEDYGISITATINKYTIYNETVSAKNPPPICVGAPYVKDLADLCLRLHDINASRSSLSACAAAEARFKHIRVANYELGCFAIGKPGTAEDLANRYRVVPGDKAQGNSAPTAASDKIYA